MALNTTDRRVIYEILCSHTGYANLEHTLYRMAHVYRDGLTEKEQQFIDNRCEALKEEMQAMAKLHERLKWSLDGKNHKS